MAQVSTPDTETEEVKPNAGVAAAVGNDQASEPSISQGRDAKPSTTSAGSQRRRTEGSEGGIDLDKLMHSIDMTRVSCGTRCLCRKGD